MGGQCVTPVDHRLLGQALQRLLFLNDPFEVHEDKFVLVEYLVLCRKALAQLKPQVVTKLMLQFEDLRLSCVRGEEL